ncbi:hypothetical protein [Sorangium sp. So ce513]|uniref:hypothetical protein n=1 Tax=Sorangium sp. So ce513 TaxID=3133315 RepID=UPI003F606367
MKALDVFHMLPGYATPTVARSEAMGGWMRLAPSSFDVGCTLARIAFDEGIGTVNSLAARDDHNTTVSSELTTHFAALGGRSLTLGDVHVRPAARAPRDVLVHLSGAEDRRSGRPIAS